MILKFSSRAILSDARWRGAANYYLIIYYYILIIYYIIILISVRCVGANVCSNIKNIYISMTYLWLVVNPILFLQYQPQIPFGQSCIALQKIISENIAGLIVADFSLIVGNIPRTIYKKNKKLSFSRQKFWNSRRSSVILLRLLLIKHVKVSRIICSVNFL